MWWQCAIPEWRITGNGPAKPSLEMAGRQDPFVLEPMGCLNGGTIVRHLILPGHTHNSIAVLEVFADVFAQGALVSLMAQYVPCGLQRISEINRRITKPGSIKSAGSFIFAGAGWLYPGTVFGNEKFYSIFFDLEGRFITPSVFGEKTILHEGMSGYP